MLKETQLFALFQEIYQQIWKVENEDVKVIDIIKNFQKHYESFYFFVPDYRSAEKRHCVAKHFLRHHGSEAQGPPTLL